MIRQRGNGSIYRQPGCKTWTISYYTHNGRRVRESTGQTDYRAAQQKLRARLVAIDKGELIEPYRRQQLLVSELYEGLERHYRINGRKSLDVLTRRWKHLKSRFGDLPVRAVTHERLNQYVDQRQAEGAKPSTINRELAALKTSMRLGLRQHRYVLPVFPHLAENNARWGFIEQADFERLRRLATEPWLRLFLRSGSSTDGANRRFLDCVSGR